MLVCFHQENEAGESLAQKVKVKCPTSFNDLQDPMTSVTPMPPMASDACDRYDWYDSYDSHD